MILDAVSFWRRGEPAHLYSMRCDQKTGGSRLVAVAVGKMMTMMMMVMMMMVMMMMQVPLFIVYLLSPVCPVFIFEACDDASCEKIG